MDDMAPPELSERTISRIHGGPSRWFPGYTIPPPASPSSPLPLPNFRELFVGWQGGNVTAF